MIIREMSAAECRELISSNRLGRLACAADRHPYVIPITYAYDKDAIYAFTLPGRKLETMRANPHVALLVEQLGHGYSWKTALAEGAFEELPDQMGFKHSRERAWSLLSTQTRWWEPGGVKPFQPPYTGGISYVFFRIRVDQVSGREALEEAGA
jgi:nitroimidazol reductase NimA-like FMN-containing flavoprotein (pyridoxamine 5'-phosphate oxidase superfamily)